MRNLLSVLLMLAIPTILAIGCQHDSANPQIIFSEPGIMPTVIQDDSVLPIRVAISSVLSPTDTIKYYREIANYIGDQLNRPAILIQRRSYNEISNLMINQGADIAFFATGAYINKAQFDGIEAIATQERMGVPFYYGYIVVHNQSGIASLNDLRGKNIAFTDPASYSGYTFVENQLAELGETPELFFGRYNFTYQHEDTLNAVINKVVDGAAVNSLVLDRAQLQHPELVKNLKIIAKSKPVGTGPIVIRSNLSNEEKRVITEGFISMHEQDKMVPALNGLFIDRFVPFEPRLYEDINEVD